MTTTPSQPPAPGPSDPWLRRHGAKLALSLVFGGGLAWLIASGGLPIVPPLAAFDGVAWWSVPVFLACCITAHVLRAVRWRHLLRPVGDVALRDVVAVSWISFAVILMSPLRTGEVVRPYLITKRSNVRLWEAAGTVGAERVIDGLFLSLLLFAGLLLSTPLDPLPDHVGELSVPVSAVPGAAYAVLALFACAFLAMAAFFFFRDLARRLVLATIGRVSTRLANGLADVATRIADGLGFLPEARLLVPFLLETTAYWAALAFGTWALEVGCGIEGVTHAEAWVTLGCVGIGILVPSGPGFFGAFQLSAFMALAMFSPEAQLRGPGAAFVFLYYVVQVAWNLLAALLALAIDPRSAPDGAAGEALEGALAEAESAAERR